MPPRTRSRTRDLRASAARDVFTSPHLVDVIAHELVGSARSNALDDESFQLPPSLEAIHSLCALMAVNRVCAATVWPHRLLERVFVLLPAGARQSLPEPWQAIPALLGLFRKAAALLVPRVVEGQDAAAMSALPVLGPSSVITNELLTSSVLLTIRSGEEPREFACRPASAWGADEETMYRSCVWLRLCVDALLKSKDWEEWLDHLVKWHGCDMLAASTAGALSMLADAPQPRVRACVAYGLGSLSPFLGASQRSKAREVIGAMLGDADWTVREAATLCARTSLRVDSDVAAMKARNDDGGLADANCLHEWWPSFLLLRDAVLDVDSELNTAPGLLRKRHAIDALGEYVDVLLGELSREDDGLLDYGTCFSFFRSQATSLDYSALSSGLKALSKKASDAGLRGMHSACDLLLDKMDDARHRLTVPGHLLAHLNVDHIIFVGPGTLPLGLMAPFALPDLALGPEDFLESVVNQLAAQAVQVLPAPMYQNFVQAIAESGVPEAVIQKLLALA
jgi:hypothetical protein